IGVVFLGDTTRPGLEPAAAAGFLLAVASAGMLARFGEAERAAASPGPAPPGSGPSAPGAPSRLPAKRGSHKNPSSLRALELPARPVPTWEGTRLVLSWWPVDLRLEPRHRRPREPYLGRIIARLWISTRCWSTAKVLRLQSADAEGPVITRASDAP